MGRKGVQERSLSHLPAWHRVLCVARAVKESQAQSQPVASRKHSDPGRLQEGNKCHSLFKGGGGVADVNPGDSGVE